jgi:hypothetical protein
MNLFSVLMECTIQSSSLCKKQEYLIFSFLILFIMKVFALSNLKPDASYSIFRHSRISAGTLWVFSCNFLRFISL